ncbi:hypothetical protein J437_LFUL010485 [Ladona fulva]|uniref:PiggyBac transposable element-derived protein 4 C-terminal zinc-finger domain-containing protein n=1 Tax=Ladona fulva TaxID=123851 RepID=A0A8K0K944_LADFU|nr:hypothetical protein J437_LFUL010485 [Ladona fulva]
MGGVDRADQFRSYYGFGRTTKKWWKYLFAFVVNTAIKDFRVALYKQMIGNFTSRKISGRKRTLPFASSSTKYNHLLIKMDGRKKACAYCSHKKRRTPTGTCIETSWQCRSCDLLLCKVGCFLAYHEEKGVDIGY